MESAKKLRAYKDAKEYIEKIGKPQPHLRDDSVGRLHVLGVETQINHQASSGGTNYWNTPAFDNALSRVVRSRFSELAEQAVALLWGDYVETRIAEKSTLLAQLAEIEALEKSA